MEYDANLNPEKIEDRNHNIWEYSYNSKGNILTSTTPLNETTRYEYDPANQDNLTKVIDPAGNIKRYEYDTNGNLIRIINVVDGIDRVTIIDRYPNGLVKTVTDPRMNTTTYEYDDYYGYLKKIIEPLGKVTQFTYDVGGRLKKETNADGINTEYTYDNMNRLKTVKNHAGKITNYDYNKNGNLKTIVDSRQITKIYSYNNRDLLTSITDANVRITKHDYDDLGRLTKITNAKDCAWGMAYDEADNLISETTSLGYTTLYSEHDGNGNLKKQEDRTGRVISYLYDTTGRLQYQTILSGSNPQYYYEYYPNGLLKKVAGAQNQVGTFEYNALEQLKKYIDPYSKSVRYTYDEAGNLKTIAYPDGKEVSYAYDARNLLSFVTDWLGNKTEYAYSQAGRLKKILYPGGAYIEYIYDTYDRLKTVNNKKANGTLIAGYTVDAFDALDAPEQITTAGGIDAINQVINIGYNYDENNRINSAGTATFTHNKLGEILSRTKDGRTTWFEWDAKDVPGRLKKINSDTTTREYLYDGLGNRISTTKNGVTTRYVLDLSSGMSNVLAETDVNGNITAYYVYGLGLVSRILPNGATRYYHYDRTGNTVALTDASGNITDQYAYNNDPFGFCVTSQGTTENPFKFVGLYGVMDEGDNIYFMRARFYDAEAGRFLSEDPLGFEGGDWNLYAYVGGNPVVGIDPEGTFSIKYNPLNAVVVSVVELPSMVGNFTQQSYYTYKYFSSYYNGEDYARNAYSELAQGSSDKMFKSVKTIARSSFGAKTSGSKTATKIFGKTGVLKVLDMRTRKGIFVKQVWTVAEKKVGKYFFKKIFRSFNE